MAGMDISARNIDAKLWHALRVVAARRDLAIREALIEAITEYVQRHGEWPPKDAKVD